MARAVGTSGAPRQPPPATLRGSFGSGRPRPSGGPLAQPGPRAWPQGRGCPAPLAGMFRASDIFGRTAGGAERPSVVKTASDAPGGKRLLSTGSAGPVSRTWDPASGQFVEDEIPAEVQHLMGLGKRARAGPAPEQTQGAAWGEGHGLKEPRVLNPVGLAPPQSRGQAGGSKVAHPEVDRNAPSVEYRGFSKVDLNDRYFERQNCQINGRPTYWGVDGQYFIYWQGPLSRWSICDVGSLAAVRAGQLPGWAYKQDHRHLSGAAGWMEAWDGSWREPEIEVCFRSAAGHKPQWEDPTAQQAVSAVEFRGFAMRELSARYLLRPSEMLQGKPSYWDPSGVYFLYWQQQMRRWAICDLKCIEAVREGQCPGWAYRRDSGHFANACGWVEMRDSEWTDAKVETAVISTCSKGLKVELSGFGKQELNTQYVERPDEVVQGRVTFWDPSDSYFIYWQSAMKRWAVCDLVSLPQAKAGDPPGWAFRTDSQHFTRSAGVWMEAHGREWRRAEVACTVLEGTVRPDAAAVKTEQAADDARLSAEQYKTLVRRVYEQKNPGKLPDLPAILDRYEGTEHELFSMVCEKYQVDADEFAAAEAAAKAAEEQPPGGEEEEEEYAHLAGAECPELTAREYATLVQNVYLRHNAKKLSDMGRLLVKYKGRERELLHEVCAKYGESPAVLHARCEREKRQAPAAVAEPV
ncbi:unnamed protein product [Prorocentrum cordatum]|uniref:Uncharacterized protein n=1 Tax=Prorocentrum cordatum TaxID=2364126 RepID=A0ABN9PRK7_9DINO|nr:unnamed protein product [Polarella glacialis]